MREIVFFAMTLWIAACGPIWEQPTPARAFSPDSATLFAADSPEERLLVCQADRSYDARWTPPQDEVDRLEPVLIQLLEYKLLEHRLTYDDLPSPEPSGFHRHYFGLVRGDHRFILVCGQYRSEPYVHHDGGEHRFAALYDVRYRAFTWFEFGFRA